MNRKSLPEVQYRPGTDYVPWLDFVATKEEAETPRVVGVGYISQDPSEQQEVEVDEMVDAESVNSECSNGSNVSHKLRDI